MTFSLSQDDDGLEPVHSSEKTPVRGTHPSLTNDGAKRSVVVDPRSQIPQARRSDPELGGRRRVHEPTLVLEGRRVDELRKQVVDQRKRLQKRKRKMAVVWALGGGLAVLAGGFLASRTSPEEAQEARSAAVALPLPEVSADDAPATADSTGEGRDSPSAPEETAAAPTPPQGVAPPPVAASPPDSEGAARANDVVKVAERQPGQPKKTRDWGDGLDRPTPRGSPRSLNLDDLEQE